MSHFKPKDRWTFLVIFLFWTIVLIGSHMAFGGYNNGLTRIITWIFAIFALLVLVAFVDARLGRKRRRHHQPSTYVQPAPATVQPHEHVYARYKGQPIDFPAGLVDY